MRLFFEILLAALVVVGGYCTVGAFFDFFPSSVPIQIAIYIGDDAARERLEASLIEAKSNLCTRRSSRVIVLFDRALLGEQGVPTKQESELLSIYGAEVYLTDKI